MSERSELVRQVKAIDITTRYRVMGLQAGRHYSVFRGRGVEFEELREYVPGDDIRSIDWKVTARLNRPYIKEFSEERDQTFYFVLDISGSGRFGSSVRKSELALRVLASMIFAAYRNNDRVGLCLVSDHLERFIRAKKGRRHVISLLNVVIDHRPRSEGTDLAAALRAITPALKRQCSVVIISDLVSPPFARELAILHTHHEVIVIRVSDPVEHALPDVGLIAVEDAESGEQLLIDTSDEGFRQRYAAVVEAAEQKIADDLSRDGIGMLTLTTAKPYDAPLSRFFSGLRAGRRHYGRIH